MTDESGGHGRLSERGLNTPRTLEGYLKAGIPPRWMERLMQIENGMRRERRRLQELYDAVRSAHADDPHGFVRRWRAIAEAQDFSEHNALVRQHNEYYPIERDLPMDPRTGEYRLIHGRDFRRPELGSAWVLEQFPPQA